MKYPQALALALAGALGAFACSDTPTALEQRGGVVVSFSTQAPTSPTPAPLPSLGNLLIDTVTSGSDTLIMTSVELVLRQIELKAAETVDCDVDPEPTGCEDVEVGPVLVDLPLTPGVQQEFQIEVATGTYSRIDFEIHKVSSDDPEDAEFRQTHPDLVEKSIRVMGTFNGAAFTYENDINVEQELQLVPALVVSEGGSLGVTILVDVSTWFVAGDGSLIDPATANQGGQNKSEVDENIKDSFNAFEDDDQDGSED
jgi:hypothetical protein